MAIKRECLASAPHLHDNGRRHLQLFRIGYRKIKARLSPENSKRLDILYRRHNKWLHQCARNITGSEILAQELVSSLYEWLANNITDKIYWGEDDVNLKYCHQFLKTRWINRVKRDGRLTDSVPEVQEEGYDEEMDKRIEKAYSDVMKELEEMKKRQGWQKAMIWQIYTEEGNTLGSVAKKIGISKSTVFSNVEKVREHLRTTICNPFTYGNNNTAFTCCVYSMQCSSYTRSFGTQFCGGEI